MSLPLLLRRVRLFHDGQRNLGAGTGVGSVAASCRMHLER